MILSSCLSSREISSGISSSTSSSASSQGISELRESVKLLLSMDLSICLICIFDLCLIKKNSFFFLLFFLKVNVRRLFFFIMIDFFLLCFLGLSFPEKGKNENKHRVWKQNNA